MSETSPIETKSTVELLALIRQEIHQMQNAKVLETRKKVLVWIVMGPPGIAVRIGGTAAFVLVILRVVGLIDWPWWWLAAPFLGALTMYLWWSIPMGLLVAFTEEARLKREDAWRD